jgi:RHS repeat-associated protein
VPADPMRPLTNDDRTRDPLRWVGDPVDVVTGVQVEVTLELQLAWKFPFRWRRLYSTARTMEFLPLGWGQTHNFDHRLQLDLDGVRYTDPEGRLHSFPALTPEQSVQLIEGGGVLREVAPNRVQVKVGEYPRCEFVVDPSSGRSRLERLWRGRQQQQLLYDPTGRWIGLRSPGERELGVALDARQCVYALYWPATTDRPARTLWQAEYDADGQLVACTDQHGAAQRFRHDSQHRIISRTDRRGYEFIAEFDAKGRCTHATGVDGMQEVRLSYAPEEQRTTVVHGDGAVYAHAYDQNGVTALTLPYGGVIMRELDADGALVTEVGPEGVPLRVRRDADDPFSIMPAFHPPVGVALPVGDPWFEAYRTRSTPRDAMGWDGMGDRVARDAIRLPRATAAWRESVPAAVLQAIRVASTDAEATPEMASAVGTPPPRKPMLSPRHPGEVKEDEFGTTVYHELPSGERARWHYDPNGNVVRYIDYDASNWQVEYASWNLRVRETDPLGGSVQWAYDNREQVVQATDAGGTVTSYARDLQSRLVERRRHGATRDRLAYDRAEGVRTIDDSAGRTRQQLLGPAARPVRVVVDGAAPRSCRYDDRGRLLEVAEEGEGGSTLSFTYAMGSDWTADLIDGVGVRRTYQGDRLTAVEALDAYVTRYLRIDDANREVVDPTGGRHRIATLEPGLRLRTLHNGVRELLQYDWHGRSLARIRYRSGDTAGTWARRYRYSGVGCLTSAEDSTGGTRTYAYDAAHRLIETVDARGARAQFSYDRAGNITSAPSLSLPVYDENRLVSTNGVSVSFDARQNETTRTSRDGVRRFEYDAEDRVSAVIDGDARIMFRYDALGRRIAKTGPLGTTRFVWDGERLAAEIAPDQSLRVYVYADRAGRTPFLLVDYRQLGDDPSTGVRRYLFADQIGAPVRIEDEAGHTVWRATYAPYGQASIEATEGVVCALRWPGHYADVETGLHYNRHRYYDAERARYIQVDPRDLAGGWNVYAYTARPLDAVDVDGLAPCPQKPMIAPDENDPEYQAAKQRADELANEMRAAMRDAVDNDELHPMNAAGTTLTALVVRNKNGEYEVIVTGNRSPAGLPKGVQDSYDGHRYVAHGDDRPPPVRQGDSDWRHGRDNPRTGEREESTHNHAEQRGLRATDCDDNVQGVAYVAPTRPCCEGCSSAIQDRGGTSANVSDTGSQPGNHGNWWD